MLGVAGDGIGQKVTINLRYESKIDTLFIKNGFNSPGDFLPNNRVKEMRVKGDEGTTVITLKDNQKLQEVKLSEPVMGKTIILEILSVYKGSRDPDTCLTEIAFEKKNITPCENIGKFKSMRIEWNNFSPYSLDEEGTLSVYGGAVVYSYTKGRWMREGENRINLSYSEIIRPEGCTGMGFGPDTGPESQGEKCAPGIKYNEIREILTLQNTCMIVSNGTKPVREFKSVEITK